MQLLEEGRGASCMGGTSAPRLRLSLTPMAGVQLALLPYCPSLQVLLPLLQTLAYLHKEGIMHRDVKPENIMFNSEKVRGWAAGP